MCYEFIYILELLKCISTKEEAQLPKQEINWVDFYKISNNHVLTPILYSCVSKLPENVAPDSALLSRWKSTSQTQSFYQLNKYSILIKLLKKVAETDFHATLIKGPFINNLYPEPHSRITSDFDFFIPPEEESQFGELLSTLGYKLEDGVQNPNELTYVNGPVRLEIHTRLWEETEGKQYDLLCSLNIDNFDNMIQTEVNGIPVYSFNVDNTIIYLFYHMIKHFFISGIGLRYLLDITLYIQHNQNFINWEIFWKRCDIMHYTKFVRAFLFICSNQLGLETSSIGNITFTDTDKKCAQTILLDIKEGGHNGKSTSEREDASYFIELYYHEKISKLSFFTIFTKQFFNKIDAERNTADLQQTSAVNNTPLSPFQQIKKVFLSIPLLFKKNPEKKQKISLYKRIKTIRYRRNILKNLNLNYLD